MDKTRLFYKILIAEHIFLTIYFLAQVNFFNNSTYIHFLVILTSACGGLVVHLYNKLIR